MPDNHVILLFIRAPIKGRVKSRLARVLGPETALSLYQNFILDGIEAIAKTGSALKIFFDPIWGGDKVSALLGNRYDCSAQSGRDLGEKMERAFNLVFSEGWGRAVLIGSDVPDVGANILLEAFDSLKAHDVVIGPAVDGGYYLIGFNKSSYDPRIFSGIPWSTSAVFPETVRRLKERPARIHYTPLWRDIDTIDDLRALYERNQDKGCNALRTMDYLTRKGLFE